MLRLAGMASVCLTLVLAVSGTARAQDLSAWLGDGGKMVLMLADRGSLGQVDPGLYGPNWSGFEEQTQEGFPKQVSADVWQYAGSLRPEEQPGSLDYTLVARALQNGVELSYEFRAERELRLNAVFVRFQMPARRFAGREVVFQDKTLSLPGRTYAGNPNPYYGRGKRVVVSLRAGELTFSLAQEAEIELQDNREWGDPSFALSFHLFHSDQARALPAGTVLRQSLRVESEEMKKVIFQPTIRSQTDSSGWFPFDLPPDVPEAGEGGFQGAVDFSASLDKPAGKHGFLQADGEHFVFADGTPVKFWGVNLDGATSLPEKDHAPLIARRMAQLGVNMVRFTLDSVAPEGLIAEGNDTRQFDPAMVDRMDYFISCLEKHGIYIRLDLMHYRRFKPGDGVDVPLMEGEEQPYCGGPAMYFQPRIEELHREFADKLLLHQNPYTKLRYVDDPALAFIGIVNENTIFFAPRRMTETSRQALEARYQEWRAGHPGGAWLRFLAETEASYLERMKTYLRSIGVKTPIAGTNMIASTAHGRLQALVGDHVEFNIYWDHPHRDWRWIRNRPMLKERGGIILPMAAAAESGKPFAITEVNYCDTSYRGEGLLLTAAYASLQDWDAVLWWDYADSGDQPGGYREFLGTTPMFSMRDNPVLLAQFGAASLAFRNSYISPGKTRVDVRLSDAEVLAEPNWIWQLSWNELRGNSPFAVLPLLCQVRSRYQEAGAHEADLVLQTAAAKSPGDQDNPDVITVEDPIAGAKADADLIWRLVRERMRELKLADLPEPGATTLLSDTGQLSWDTENGTLTVNTPQLQGAIGFLAGRTFQLADFTIELDAAEGKPQAPFAAVSLCSLDGRPLKESSRILLTAVGRAEDTGQSWEASPADDFAATAGKRPVLAEPVRGRVIWHGRKLKAFPLAPSGQRLQEMSPTAHEGGEALAIGDSNTVWYELTPAM